MMEIPVDSGPETPKRPEVILFPHQERFVGDIVRAVIEHEMPKVYGIAPPSAGKGVCEPVITQRIEEYGRPVNNVLSFCTGLSLAAQKATDMAAIYGGRRDLEMVIVCSDEGVKDRVELENLANKDIRVLTSADELREILRARRNGNALRLVISTYHSAPVVNAAQKGISREFPGWDIKYLDEADVAATWDPESPFASSLQTKALISIGMTGTELVRSKEEKERGAISMDDREYFGPKVTEISLADLISQRTTTADYRVRFTMIGRSALQDACDSAPDSLLAKAVKEALAKKQTPHNAIKAYSLAMAMANEERKRAIAFSNRVSDSKELKAIFDDLPQVEGARRVETYHVDGRSGVRERTRAFGGFMEEDESVGKLFFNVRVIARGLNLEADTIATLDPRESVQEVNQNVGRAVRAPKAYRERAVEIASDLLASGFSGSVDEYEEILRERLEAEGLQQKQATVAIPMYYDDSDPASPVLDPEYLALADGVIESIRALDPTIWEKGRVVVPDAVAPLAPWSQKRSAENAKTLLAVHEIHGEYAVERLKEALESMELRHRMQAPIEPMYAKARPEHNSWEAMVPEPNGKMRSLGMHPNEEAAQREARRYIIERGLPYETPYGMNPHTIVEQGKLEVSMGPHIYKYGKQEDGRGRGEANAYNVQVPWVGYDSEHGDIKPRRPFRSRSKSFAYRVRDAGYYLGGLTEMMYFPDERPKLELWINEEHRIEGYEEEQVEIVPPFTSPSRTVYWAYAQEEGGLAPVQEAPRPREEPILAPPAFHVGYFDSLERAIEASRTARDHLLAFGTIGPVPADRLDEELFALRGILDERKERERLEQLEQRRRVREEKRAESEAMQQAEGVAVALGGGPGHSL